jgi:predicted dehydrogenase
VSGDLRGLRIGIVGSGAMAEYHAKKFSSIPGVTVTGCADRSAEHAQGFARRLGIRSWFTSAADLAASGEVDCLSTALVDAAHARAALDAFQHGRAVFAEKPLARTLAEAEAMRDAARDAGVPAVVNFSKRNAPAVALARTLIADGRLGPIRGGSFRYLQSWLLQDAWGKWDTTPRWRWRVCRSQSTEGVIGDLGSHLIDTIRFLLGNIREVSCSATTFTADPERPAEQGAPDSFAAVLRMEPGYLLAMRASWRARGHLDELAFEVEGEEGSLAVDLAQARDTVRVFNARGESWSELKAPPPRSTYEQFVDELRGSVTRGPGFPDGVEVQRAIDACSRSAREGRALTLPPGASA